MTISRQVNSFLDLRKFKNRYTSFDFCYSYFYSFYKNDNIKTISNDENIEQSCLHIGFYLASWGMMRGSSFLLQKSLGILKELVIEISKLDKEIWGIDIDSYSEENIEKILKTYNLIKDVFIRNGYTTTPTLITKIQLGIFGNIPAFDRYFKIGFGINSVNKKNLIKIYNFYQENKNIIDNYQISCYDFLSEDKNYIFYTKAKIIDMYGFNKGFK